MPLDALHRAVLRQRRRPHARSPDAVPLLRQGARTTSRSPPPSARRSATRSASRAAVQIRGDDVVVGGWLGDGATSSNDFHAGLNFAGVWKAPVVFVCQNNQWAISVPVGAQTASETHRRQGRGLRHAGPPRRRQRRAGRATSPRRPRWTARAAARARRFVECLTYRMGGHSSSDDPTKYRDEAEAKALGGARSAAAPPHLAHVRGPVEPYAGKRTTWPTAGREVTEAIARVEASAAVPVESLFDGRVGRGAARSWWTSANDCSARNPSDAARASRATRRRHGDRVLPARGDRLRPRRLRRGHPRRAARPQDGRHRGGPDRRRVPEHGVHPVQEPHLRLGPRGEDPARRPDGPHGRRRRGRREEAAGVEVRHREATHDRRRLPAEQERRDGDPRPRRVHVAERAHREGRGRRT